MLDNIRGPLYAYGRAGAIVNLVLNDLGNLSDNLVYTIDGSSVKRSGGIQFWYSLLNSLTIKAGTGTNKRFDILATAANIDVGAGTNLVNLGKPDNTGTLNALLGTLSLRGAAGTNDLAFNDQGNTNSPTYTVTDTTVQRGTFMFTYNLVRNLTLNTGTGANTTVNVLGTAAGTTTTVNVGNGTETLNLGYPDFTGTLNNFRGPFRDRGVNGPIAINFNDKAYDGPGPYTLSGADLARPGVDIAYADARTLNLNTGLNNTTVTLMNLPATASVSIIAGAGGAAVEIPQGVISTSQVHFSNVQLLTVDGGTLNVNTALTIPDLILSSGTLTGDASLTVLNTANWSGGTMSGRGRTIVGSVLGGGLSITGPDDKWYGHHRVPH